MYYGTFQLMIHRNNNFIQTSDNQLNEREGHQCLKCLNRNSCQYNKTENKDSSSIMSTRLQVANFIHYIMLSDG